MRLIALALAVLFSTAAQAQQPDPVFLQRALAAVQTQRNMALDAAAVAEAKAALITEELAKVQVRIKDLEAKVEEKK